jgi:hypothetical protein
VTAVSILRQIPWPLFLGLVAFAIGFVLQFRVRHHIDREKVLVLEDMGELYSGGMPPKKILTEHGRRLYLLMQIAGWVFMGSVLLFGILYCR